MAAATLETTPASASAPAYLPFFQTSYGNAFGYNERAKNNARVFENRHMHATWRGSAKLTDLTPAQINEPVRSSYNAKVKVAKWPKPKPTFTLPAAAAAPNAGKSSAAPAAAPERESQRWADRSAAFSGKDFTQTGKSSEAPYSPSPRPASASASGAGTTNGFRGGVTFMNENKRFVDEPESARSFGADAPSPSPSPRPHSARVSSEPSGAIAATLSATDKARLAHYRTKWGAGVKLHSTRGPQQHFHQNNVRVESRVRPDDHPCNVYRLEAEANWDKWSISRFHRGLTTRVPGYTGYVPRVQWINGETYGRATRMAFGGPRDDGVRPPTPPSKNGLTRAPAPKPSTVQTDYDPLNRSA